MNEPEPITEEIEPITEEIERPVWWWVRLQCWWYRLFHHPKPSAWDALKGMGYTIERHHIKGFYICTPDGHRCGPIFGNFDQLMGRRDEIAKLEIKRLGDG